MQEDDECKQANFVLADRPARNAIDCWPGVFYTPNGVNTPNFWTTPSRLPLLIIPGQVTRG